MAELQLGTLKDVELGVRKATSPSRETSDGNVGAAWGLRDGAVVTVDWYTAMALEGRVFNIANATPDTTMTGSVNYDATHPGVYVGVPDGAVMVPVHFDVVCEDAAGTDTHFHIGCDDAELYSSGGTAVSACNNIRTDNPHASAVSAKYASDSAITITDPGATERILYNKVYAFANEADHEPYQVVWEPKAPPILVGPASFFVYIYAASTAPEYNFSLQWVELPKNAVV